MFSLICAWINSWENTHEAGDLRRHRADYNVTVMMVDDFQWCIGHVVTPITPIITWKESITIHAYCAIQILHIGKFQGILYKRNKHVPDLNVSFDSFRWQIDFWYKYIDNICLKASRQISLFFLLVPYFSDSYSHVRTRTLIFLLLPLL